MLRSGILFAMIIATLAAHAGSQAVAPGDVIVAVRGGAAYVNWSSLFGVQPGGKVYTITSRLFRDPTAVVPAPDNQGVWVATNGQTGPGALVMHVDPGGTITTLQPVRMLTMSVNSSGEVIGTDGHRILSVSSRGVTTLAAGLPLINVRATTFDLKSGDLVLGVTDRIYRMSLRTPGKLTTVIDFGSQSIVTWGLHADPVTGALFGSRQVPYLKPGGAVHEIFRLDLGPPPVVTSLWSRQFHGNTGPWGRSPATGRFFVPAWEIAPWATAILEFDPRAGTVTTMATVGGLGSSTLGDGVAVAVAGSRYLTATAPAYPGGTLVLLVQSPTEPGAPYAIALSFGFRPGIQVATGRKIHLNPDPLFFYSLTNTGIFSGFQGSLNTQGLGVGRLAIPAIAQLSGVRFFAAAITLAGNRVSVISEPLGVTIR